MSAFPLADCKSASEYRDTGQIVDKVTRAILISAEKELGYPLSMLQGGNRPVTAYSASTHGRLGVGDLPAYDWHNKCEVLISLGCYAYHRPYLAGKWGEHIHFGVIDHPWRDALLVDQQDDWLHNPPLNGLSGHARYVDGPHTGGKKIVFKYDSKTELELVPMNKVQRAREELVLAIHNIGDAAALMDEVVNRPAVDLHLKHLKAIHKNLRLELKEMPKK